MRKYYIYDELMKMNVSARHRAFLDYVAPKCYVEASGTNQHGTVVKVIRNKNHVPIMLEVENPSGKDRIACSDVDFFEPFNEYVSDVSEYEDFVDMSKEEIMAMDVSDDIRRSYLDYYCYSDDDEDGDDE